MTKGLPRSLSRGSLGQQEVVKQVIQVRALAMNVDGATGIGFGSAIAGDFPEGNILFLGAVAYLAFSGPIDAGLVDTWEGDFGVGTTPASDATLTSGDVDIVPSTALAAATLEVSPRTRGVQPDGSLTGQVFDNTDGSLELNVSLLVDDLDISADGIAMTVEGEIFLIYSVLGND